jgi:hypothetical protein
MEEEEEEGGRWIYMEGSANIMPMEIIHLFTF